MGPARFRCATLLTIAELGCFKLFFKHSFFYYIKCFASVFIDYLTLDDASIAQ